jgi:tetratricopeptide (TPR) repeat protein
MTALLHSLNAPETAVAAYRQGSQAAAAQDYRGAVAHYTDALAFDRLDGIVPARLLEYRGQCYKLLGEFGAAAADYAAALAATDDPDQTARMRMRLGELRDEQGDYEQATDVYQQALQEGTAVGNLFVIGRVRRGLGVIQCKQGNTDSALTHLTQALAIFRQLGEAREQARSLISLGRTRHARGEYQYALTAHYEALKILEALHDGRRIGQALNDIGECHQALYDVERAYHYHERALRLADTADAQTIKPEILRNLGVDLVEQGRYETGMTFMQAALETARELGHREQEALALYSLARGYLRRGNIEEAMDAVADLSQVAEALDTDRYRALAAFVRGELLYQQGHAIAAMAELNSAALAAQTSVDRGVLWKLHATMSHVIDNEDVAAVHRTIAAEFIRQTAEPIQDPRLKAGFLHAPPVLAVLQAAGLNPDKL